MSIQGAIYGELVVMVRKGWEIEYTYGGYERFYQRNGSDSLFEIYVLRDGEIVHHRAGDDMDKMSEEVHALRIYDGKTAEEAEQGICVQFEV